LLFLNYWFHLFRQDKNLVKFLFTLPNVVEDMRLVSRKGGRVAHGEPFEVKEINQPKAIFLYNLFMGG